MKAIYAMMMVAGVAMAGQAVAAGGKDLYEKTCKTCHATGVAGAPKLGDKAAWAPRIKAGNEAMYNTALKGKGAMPPKGTAPATTTDAEIKATVDYMVSQSK
jgi:cytochrome c5